MTCRRPNCLPLFILAACFGLSPGPNACEAQQEDAAASGVTPFLRYDAGGTQNVVRALAFSPDGNTLYVAGWNKMVQVYRRETRSDPFVYQPRENYRVPIGEGRFGMLEAAAVSPDGRWLVVGGSIADARAVEPAGYVWPRSGADVSEYEATGALYVFDTRTRRCRILRGHRGGVRDVKFVDGDSQTLVSVGFEYSGQQIRQAVRAWSLTDASTIGEPLDLPRVMIPPSSDIAPRIRAWRTDSGELQVAVAAWRIEGGQPRPDVRIWNPQSGVAPRIISNAPVTFALALTKRSDRRHLVTAGLGDPAAWPIRDRSLGPRIPIAASGFGSALPLAAVRIAATDNNANDRAAMIAVERRADGDKFYRLAMLAGDRLRVVGTLWRNGDSVIPGPVPLIEPVLAATADGAWLAAAGSRQNEIRIYRVRDLPTSGNGNADLRPAQILESRVVIPLAAVFASSAEQSGVALISADGTPPPNLPQPGTPLPADALIVSTQRRLATDPAGWTAQLAEPDGWTTVVSSDGATVSAVHPDSGERRSLQVPADFRAPESAYEVTARAICPAIGENPPLAAVAWHVQGEPMLAVFDAESGAFLRELQGHDHRITSLAFSEDGGRLLSSSFDGTVRGWLLSDLATATIGQVGWIRGLFVADDEDGLRVDRVETGSPAAEAGIRLGDRLDGLLLADDPMPISLSSAADLYNQVSQIPPENHAEVTLRVRREGRAQDLVIPLQQGADLRSPLFSLLISEPPADASRGWLVWTPSGQFDASGDALEQRLGWHFNTTDEAQPVTFASVDQYRDRFYRDGLLRQLLQGPLTVRQIPDEPLMRVSLVTDEGQVVTPNYEDELVTRRFASRLVLEFEQGSGALVEHAEWSIPGGTPEPLTQVESDLWVASDLLSVLGRGAHAVQLRVASPTTPAGEHRRTVFLRYQPAAPRLTLRAPDQTAGHVSTPELPIDAGAEFAVPGTVTLIHEADGEVVAERQSTFTESGTFTDQVALRPGENRIRLVATNQDIPASVARFADAESHEVETLVEYTPVGPPVITLVRCRDGEGEERLHLDDGLLVTDTPELTVDGVIASESPLTEATVAAEEPPQRLEGLVPGRSRELEFTRVFRLQPGEQTIVWRARSGNQSSEFTLTVNYRPLLPEFRLEQPTDPAERIVRNDDPLFLPIRVRLANAADREFDWDVLVDGVVSDAVRSLTEDGDVVLSGDLPVVPDASQSPDTHRLDVVLRNAWGRERIASRTITILHPPRIQQPDVSRSPQSAVAELQCLASADSQRPITAVHVQINGERVESPEFSTGPVTPDGVPVVVSGLPLREGDNEIEVVVVNRDGRSAPLRVTETVEPPKRAAEIALVRPQANTTATRSPQPLVFEVRSRSGLRRVDVIITRDGQRPERRTLLRDDTSAAEPVRRRFELQLPLTAGENRVRLLAQNAGGLQRRDVAVTYLPPPVSLHLAGISAADDSWAISVADPAAERVEFREPAADGQAVVHGAIRWLPGHRPPGGTWTVRVWVNGFLRSSRVTPPDGDARSVEFAVPVVLNQEQNRLRIEAPAVTFDDQRLALDDHRIPALGRIAVRCAEPDRRQRLHLVIMGVEMQDGRNLSSAEQLLSFAEEALRVQAPESAFAEIRNYSPLVGEKAVGRNLRTLMVLVETDIAQRRAAGRLNDVVMFYYRGREYRDTNGEFVLEDFQNHLNPLEHPLSIREGYLARLFESLPGAHVVFLDVESPDNDLRTASHWPQFPNLGLFRVVWTGQPPVPEPPGPLLSMVRSAEQRREPDGSVRLETLEQALLSLSGDSGEPARFRVATLVPEDLLSLMIARFGAAADQ